MFKLEELDQKYRLLHNGSIVVDLGAEVQVEEQNIAAIDDEIAQLDRQIAALGVRRGAGPLRPDRDRHDDQRRREQREREKRRHEERNNGERTKKATI